MAVKITSDLGKLLLCGSGLFHLPKNANRAFVAICSGSNHILTGLNLVGYDLTQLFSERKPEVIKIMMATASLGMSRTMQAVRPHIPLIKFRKGGNRTTDAMASASPSLQIRSSQDPKIPNVGPYIDDTQLPEKYRRKPVSPVEMEYINRGGPE